MARFLSVVAAAAIGLTACGANSAVSDSSATGETLAPVDNISPVTADEPTTTVAAPPESTPAEPVGTATPSTAAPTTQFPTPTRRIEIEDLNTLVVPLLGEISPEPRFQTNRPLADFVLAAEYWRSDDLYLVSAVVQNVIPRHPDDHLQDVITVDGVEWSIFSTDDTLTSAVTSVAVVDGIAYSISVSELGPDRDFPGPSIDFLIDIVANTSIER
jgi:hypothetical protein